MTENSNSKFHLVVIAGPTASGKTNLATKLAHRLNADLISADSRQVYKGLDLGTGKDLIEYQNFDPPIRYHLIDHVGPREIYSLIHFQQDCYSLIDNLSQAGQGRRDLAILVGGTGMYIEAVLKRYRIANIPENESLRLSYAEKSREELEEILLATDSEQAAMTDLSSRKRILRSLEIAESKKQGIIPYSPLPKIDFTFTVYALAWDRALLRERIDKRLQSRLEAGMVDEVKGLIAQGVDAQRLRLLGMEYAEIVDFIQGVKDYPTMVEDLRHRIHLLAKRQETYFRGMERRGIPVQWIKPEQGLDQIFP